MQTPVSIVCCEEGLWKARWVQDGIEWEAYGNTQAEAMQAFKDLTKGSKGQ